MGDPVDQLAVAQAPIPQSVPLQYISSHAPATHYYAPTYTYAPLYQVVAPQAQPVQVQAPQPVIPQVQMYAPSFSHETYQTSQFHSQDENGNYNYGWSNPLSSKQETRNAGVVTGEYSYVDANGILQTVKYIADDNGFRVQATNLPVAPAPTPVAPEPAPNPEPVPVPAPEPEPVPYPPETEDAENDEEDGYTFDLRQGVPMIPQPSESEE